MFQSRHGHPHGVVLYGLILVSNGFLCGSLRCEGYFFSFMGTCASAVLNDVILIMLIDVNSVILCDFLLAAYIHISALNYRLKRKLLG